MAEALQTSPAARRRSDAALEGAAFGGAAFALTWHAAFAVAVAAGLGALAARDLLPPGPALAALAAIGGAALLGAVLSLIGGAARAVAVLAWGVAGAAACQLTGGTGGPLAVWCLAPAAAATAFRSRDLLALGAAAALAAAAVSILDATLIDLPAAPAAAAPWLSLLALVTTTLGLSAGLIGFQGVARRDNRRQARAEAVLQLMDRQPLLLATLDRTGRIATAAGATIGGLTPLQLEGKSLGALVADADLPDLAAALHACGNTGRASLYVGAADDPDGWLEVTLRAADGQTLVAAVRDARDQAARERRLDAARVAAEQQNAGKSRFLANMSHELRTPLNAIMGFSDIMRQRLFGPLGDRYAEYSDLIHESGAHLLELINDVLDMSKIEAERFELTIETFDVRDAVEAVLRLMRGQSERYGVNLRGVLPTGPLFADADRRALKQIALNLISNALKFTPRGGSVTVTLHGVGDTLELVVADTGVGIADGDIGRLGQPYEQAGDRAQRSKGSGLGLSLVRAFARLHNGEMVVESSIGEGTSVTIRLPVLTTPAVAQDERARA
jgi:cell cycle sensor histidine kinase DivJ